MACAYAAPLAPCRRGRGACGLREPKATSVLKKSLLFTIISLLLALLPTDVAAQTPEADTESPKSASGDSLTVSLLTCSPGPAVYELYGHTALRVKRGRADDWVFNYGTFSFRQPHFVWRFVLGQTDYSLSVTPYPFFYEAYAREGRAITEQRLSLTQDEARRLEQFLGKNLEPANATYRYNFFYDNCTTRAVDAIAGALDGKIAWAEADSAKTLRDIVHQYSEASPWNKFGQDLLLGAEADKPVGVRGQMFAPLYAQMFAAGAAVKANDGTARPLAAPVVTLLPEASAPSRPCPVTPLMVFTALLAVVALATAWELRRHASLWWLDALLLFAQGLAGCVIAFLFFFSAHPAVGSNWLVTVFNPLPLLYFPWYMKQAAQGRPAYGMYGQAVMLAVCLVAGLAGLQSYPLEVYLILAALALRCAVALARTRRG